MKISIEIVKKLNPCLSRFNNFRDNYPDFIGSLEDFLMLDNITYEDKVWVFVRLATKEQNVRWALMCASKVLSIFESLCPDDKRPRLALEATESYLNYPSEANRLALKAAARAAAYAADSAVYAAAYAADSAVYAARSAAYAAAADAAYAAADAADAAAYAAAYAADSIEKELNLIFMVAALEEA